MTYTAWSADGKRVVEIEGDPNHQFYVSIPTADESAQGSPLCPGARGEVRSQLNLPPTISSLENSGASTAASPLFRRQGE